MFLLLDLLISIISWIAIVLCYCFIDCIIMLFLILFLILLNLIIVQGNLRASLLLCLYDILKLRRLIKFFWLINFYFTLFNLLTRLYYLFNLFLIVILKLWRLISTILVCILNCICFNRFTYLINILKLWWLII